MLRRLLNVLSSSVWIVRLNDGGLSVVKGPVPPRFVSDCREALEAAGVQSGQVSGRQAGGYVTLDFSKEIPKGLHQRLRNLWADYDKR